MKSMFLILSLLLTISAEANTCGRVSQLAHANACLGIYAAALPEANVEPVYGATGSENAYAGLRRMIAENKSRSLNKAAALAALDSSEFVGIVFEMQDEVIAHYVALESGAAPKLIFSFNTVDAPEIQFPTLLEKEPAAFSLYIRGFPSWVYELFQR